HGKAGIPTDSKSNTSCADSNLEPQEKVEAQSKVCLHWDLASRVELKLEISRVAGTRG
ncbi:hypothetical protein AVEN_207353-1, partial [Araneus ventricosus]